MNSIRLLGFGRFGKVLTNILQKGFTIKTYDPEPHTDFPGVVFTSLEDVLTEKVIFIAVPINQFESVIKDISPRLTEKTTIIDVCSVKIHPVEAMLTHLPESVGIIATHPMFGPDSVFSNRQLKMMMNNTRDTQNQFKFWKRFFHDQGIKTIVMSADKHDRMAANTQGVTHFLGRMLKEFGIRKTSIDTQGFKDLIDLVDQTCHDSWELYYDLQRYNPYTDEMIRNLVDAVDALNNKLQQS